MPPTYFEPRTRPGRGLASRASRLIDAVQNASHSDDAAIVPPVPLIGLTGTPAAGKTTVAKFLADAGCVVVDVDGLGHRALEEPAMRAFLVAEFGPEVVAADGTVDRTAIGRVAFRSSDALRRLEERVHPRVRSLITEEVARARERGCRAVILDVALLFEGGLSRMCDVTVAVDAPAELRARRAVPRGWDADELARRQSQQLSSQDKRARADRVLRNDADLKRLRERTLALLNELAPVRTTGAPHTGA